MNDPKSCGAIRKFNKNAIFVESKNNGQHLILMHDDRCGDFFTAAGDFKLRGNARVFNGVNLAVKIMRGDYTQEQLNEL
tara:strand:+ start:49 stop:285 length:237 start_codon:yes stop_codon:yes gene_type:complete